ncbi:MAG: YigZ family protein [Candidatus Cloacimonetes bacterium]|nr:YigZ family protein [Candidatus Cloacimonadota bacterium]
MTKTISQKYQAEIKIQRSRFIATVYPVQDAAEIKNLLLEHHHLYADATHNCYAYVLGAKQETTYYADAGEPSGTAGKPILNELLRNDLTNILAVVTRYFGGIKLGVKGLIEAYGEAVATVIAASELQELRIWKHLSVTCDYPSFEALKHKAEEWEAIISKVAYLEQVSFDLAIPEENWEPVLEIMDGYIRTSRLNYIQKDKGKI